jgi:hypothetical protein
MSKEAAQLSHQSHQKNSNTNDLRRTCPTAATNNCSGSTSYDRRGNETHVRRSYVSTIATILVTKSITKKAVRVIQCNAVAKTKPKVKAGKTKQS